MGISAKRQAPIVGARSIPGADDFLERFMNLFKLFSAMTSRLAEPAGVSAVPTLSMPRLLGTAEVAAVAGGPTVKNDGA